MGKIYDIIESNILGHKLFLHKRKYKNGRLLMTPSKRRREGRRAFEDGAQLEDNPWRAESYAEDWDEGWREAAMAAEEVEEETEYTVFATWNHGNQEDLGELEFGINFKNCLDMPTELEIDGVVYKPEF